MAESDERHKGVKQAFCDAAGSSQVCVEELNSSSSSYCSIRGCEEAAFIPCSPGAKLTLSPFIS